MRWTIVGIRKNAHAKENKRAYVSAILEDAGKRWRERFTKKIIWEWKDLYYGEWGVNDEKANAEGVKLL